MKALLLWVGWLVAPALLPGNAGAQEAVGARDVWIADSHSPEELLTSEAAFLPFASKVKEVDQRLIREGGVTDVQMKELRTIQVHLALHLGDSQNALAAVTAIRDSQTTAAERAFSGISAEAIVAAEKASGEAMGGADFPAQFEREFSTRLVKLPRTPEIRAILINQRKKIAGLSHLSIRTELMEKVGQVRSPKGYSLAEVDQIVRAHHQYTDLLSIQAQTVRVLDRFLK